MEPTQTPTTLAAPTVDVPQILTTLAAQLLTTPDARLGTLTVTRAVLTIAGVTPSQLDPVWGALPLGGLGNLGHTHAAYAELLLTEAAAAA